MFELQTLGIRYQTSFYAEWERRILYFALLNLGFNVSQIFIYENQQWLFIVVSNLHNPFEVDQSTNRLAKWELLTAKIYEPIAYLLGEDFLIDYTITSESVSLTNGSNYLSNGISIQLGKEEDVDVNNYYTCSGHRTISELLTSSNQEERLRGLLIQTKFKDFSKENFL